MQIFERTYGNDFDEGGRARISPSIRGKSVDEKQLALAHAPRRAARQLGEHDLRLLFGDDEVNLVPVRRKRQRELTLPAHRPRMAIIRTRPSWVPHGGKSSIDTA